MKSENLGNRVAVLEQALATTQLAVNGLAARVQAFEEQGTSDGGNRIVKSEAQDINPRRLSRPNGKYGVLTDWLVGRKDRMAINATFAEVEEILGFPLPESAYNYQPYWQGRPNPLAHSVLAAGWKVTSLSLVGKSLVFKKIMN